MKARLLAKCFGPVVMALTVGVLGCGPNDDTPAASVVETGFKRVNEVDLYYEMIGSGDPIVLVHGGPGLDHGYFLPGMEALARRHRLILYDQRGLGRSSGELDSASMSFDNFLRDLDGLREAFEMEKLDLLGHSWGGLLAMSYAIQYPDRVGSLILMSTIEPGQRYREETAANQRDRRTPEDSSAFAVLVASERFQKREPDAVSEMFRIAFRSTFADRAAATRLVVNLNQQTARNGSEIARLVMTPLGAYDFWDELSQVTAPTLVLHGAQDPIPWTMAREISERVPGSEFVLIDGAGHFPYVERPAEVAAAVGRFLEGR